MAQGFEKLNARLAALEAVQNARNAERAKWAAKGADFEDLLEEMLGATARGAGDLVERMRSGLRAYLDALAAEPAFARAFLIEVVAAGPRAEARRAEVHARFAELFSSLHATRPPVHVAAAVPRATVGAINELVSDYVRSGRTAELPELEDTILYLELVLFAGHDAAASAMRA
jgi:hypothetical protein